ncbi:MAG: chorismate synthase [Nitrospirota bacterium]
MYKLRLLTAGESHGKGLVGILEGIPAGLPLAAGDIDKELKRRQGGHGRGGRMKIEQDRAEILAGVRWGRTLGSPLALLVENRDWKNWQDGMSADTAHEGSLAPVTRPRPGHADLAGALKYSHRDLRNILERSSARETAIKVALGAVAKRLLAEFGVTVGSYVIQIGSAGMSRTSLDDIRSRFSPESDLERIDASPVRCPDEAASRAMVELIDRAARNGDTLGGVFEVVAAGAPPGLGSHIQWDKRLDSRLAQALMGIQAIKGVEIGDGFDMAGRFGSEVMDEIFYSSQPSAAGHQHRGKDAPGFYRTTNHAGGIEGGITNGMPVIIRAAMKPIPTLKKALRSVDIETKEPFEAAYERSDTCAVPAAAVIAEAMAALVIADALLEKFGGDSVHETKRNAAAYKEYLGAF